MTLALLEGRGDFTTTFDVRASGAVVENYPRVHGSATSADAADFLGTASAVVKAAWPENLVEIDVKGRTAFTSA